MDRESMNHLGYGLRRLNGLLLMHEAHIAVIVGMQYRGPMFRTQLEHPVIQSMRERSMSPIPVGRYPLSRPN